MANAATVGSPARSQIRTLSGINLVLGAWLIIVPFLVGAPAAAVWNDVLVGALVLVLAGVRVSGGPMWNDVTVGVLILAFGAWTVN